MRARTPRRLIKRLLARLHKKFVQECHPDGLPAGQTAEQLTEQQREWMKGSTDPVVVGWRRQLEAAMRDDEMRTRYDLGLPTGKPKEKRLKAKGLRKLMASFIVYVEQDGDNFEPGDREARMILAWRLGLRGLPGWGVPVCFGQPLDWSSMFSWADSMEENCFSPFCRDAADLADAADDYLVGIIREARAEALEDWPESVPLDALIRRAIEEGK